MEGLRRKMIEAKLEGLGADDLRRKMLEGKLEAGKEKTPVDQEKEKIVDDEVETSKGAADHGLKPEIEAEKKKLAEK